jgi:hypothetical protein
MLVGNQWGAIQTVAKETQINSVCIELVEDCFDRRKRFEKLSANGNCFGGTVY